MTEIKCPNDLNQFILGEPAFENQFPEEECEQKKFYGDCYHCFSTAIASRDHQLKICKIDVLDKIRTEIEQTAKDYDKFADYRRVYGLWIALDIINKYVTKSEVE